LHFRETSLGLYRCAAAEHQATERDGDELADAGYLRQFSGGHGRPFRVHRPALAPNCQKQRGWRVLRMRQAARTVCGWRRSIVSSALTSSAALTLRRWPDAEWDIQAGTVAQAGRSNVIASTPNGLRDLGFANLASSKSSIVRDSVFRSRQRGSIP
jgi:hypothetical protein